MLTSELEASSLAELERYRRAGVSVVSNFCRTLEGAFAEAGDLLDLMSRGDKKASQLICCAAADSTHVGRRFHRMPGHEST